MFPPYSFLSASIGDNREALFAGYSPKRIPMPEDTMSAINIHGILTITGNPAMSETIIAKTTPIIIPIVPPDTVMTTDSIKN